MTRSSVLLQGGDVVGKGISPPTHLRSRLQGHLVADAHDVQLLGQCMDANAKLTNICSVQAIDAVRAENTLLLHRHHGEALAPRWWQQTRGISGGSSRRKAVHARIRVISVAFLLPVGFVETWLGLCRVARSCSALGCWLVSPGGTLMFWQLRQFSARGATDRKVAREVAKLTRGATK